MKRILEVTITGRVEIDTDDCPDGATALECVDIDMDVDSAGFVNSIDVRVYTAKWVKENE
jgi:hypothetical protein